MRHRCGSASLGFCLGASLVGCTEPNPYLPGAETGATDVSSGAEGGRPSEDGSSTASGGDPAECASPGMECVEEPAVGWAGPFAWVERSTQLAPVPCTAPWDVELLEAYSEVSAPEPDCACDCGAASGAMCTGIAFLARFEDDAKCEQQDEELIVINPCVAVPSDGWPDVGSFLFTPPVVVGGECEPLERFEIVEPSFRRHHRACGAQPVEATCAPGQRCLPRPADPFYPRWCVWREGDSECPAAGPYTERTVVYREIDDGRGCTACSCAPPHGACEGSTMALTLDAECQILSGVSAEPEMCTSAAESGEVIRGLAYDPGTPPSRCEPSTSTPVGAAAGTDAVTFCCTP